MKILQFILIVIFGAVYVAAGDFYSENLFLRPLQNNQLVANFDFVVKSDLIHDDVNDIFSKVLRDIYARYELLEIQLSFTSGSWSYESLGLPNRNVPGTGVELIVWFRPHLSDDQIELNWRKLLNRLSGLVCASISSIDQSRTVSPYFTFRPVSEQYNDLMSNYSTRYVRYGQLPRETICTENLTPWKKFLPCYGLSQGLVSLLNSNDLYNTRFMSFEIRIRQVCGTSNDCSAPQLELVQSASLVYDALFFNDRHWSLRKLFGQGLLKKCPFAEPFSAVTVDVTNNYDNRSNDRFDLSPDSFRVSRVSIDGETRYWAAIAIEELMDQSKYNVVLKFDRSEPLISFRQPAFVTCNHYRLGFSEDYGQFVTRVRNNQNRKQEVLLLVTYPAFTHIYYHTLKIRTANGTELNANRIKLSSGSVGDSLSVNTRAPFVIELFVDLPESETVYMTVDFDHVFLKWLQYPPDASHGFYLPSVILTANISTTRRVQMRSEAILLLLPIPDFSMPYNVICLTCTMLAVGFGPIYNVTTKAAKVQSSSSTSFKQRFLLKLKSFFQKQKVE